MANGWGRFAWWLANDSTAPATLVQSLSSILTAIVTVVLCRLTSRYVGLTRQLAEINKRQLLLTASPNIGILVRGIREDRRSYFGISTIIVEITNKSAFPVKVLQTSVEWDKSFDPPSRQREIISRLVNRIIPSQGQIGEMIVLPLQRAIDNVEAWVERVTVIAKCVDVAEATQPLDFYYTPAVQSSAHILGPQGI